jgi:hypothetical protein
VNYTLTVSEEQARVIEMACEAYCRMHLGQFHYAVRGITSSDPRTMEQIREIEELAYKMNMIFTGYDTPHAGHGIFNPKVHEHGKIAHDVQSVIRHRLAWDRQPEGPQGSQGPIPFYEPLQSAKELLPSITASGIEALKEGEPT